MSEPDPLGSLPDITWVPSPQRRPELRRALSVEEGGRQRPGAWALAPSPWAAAERRASPGVWLAGTSGRVRGSRGARLPREEAVGRAQDTGGWGRPLGALPDSAPEHAGACTQLAPRGGHQLTGPPGGPGVRTPGAGRAGLPRDTLAGQLRACAPAPCAGLPQPGPLHLQREPEPHRLRHCGGRRDGRRRDAMVRACAQSRHREPPICSAASMLFPRLAERFEGGAGSARRRLAGEGSSVAWEAVFP